MRTEPWQPIDTAPMDGRLLKLRRIYDGRTIKEGEGRFALLHERAPARSGLNPDPLNRLSAADYERERMDREAFCSTPKWLTADRMYPFPAPTHWMLAENERPTEARK